MIWMILDTILKESIIHLDICDDPLKEVYEYGLDCIDDDCDYRFSKNVGIGNPCNANDVPF